MVAYQNSPAYASCLICWL